MKHKYITNAYERVSPMINTVDIVDNKGRTSLLNACIRGNVEIAEVLIKTGSDVNKTDYEGFSPINLASRCGQTAICELLIYNGVDINKVGKTKSPLMEACSCGHLETVVLLIDNKADPYAVDEELRSSLF